MLIAVVVLVAFLLLSRSPLLARRVYAPLSQPAAPAPWPPRTWARVVGGLYGDAVLLATGASTEVAEVIKRHTAKLSINDNERVAAAIDHYEPHIDFDKLLE